MRTTRIASLALGIVLILAACGTPEVTVQNTPATEDTMNTIGIAVSGRGEVMGTPDTLSVDIGVSILRNDVSTAVADAATRADQLIGTLRDLGVDEKDIRTANYSIYPEYDYSRDDRKLVGYRVDNTVTAKIRELDKAGEIIDAASTGAGDDIRVNGLRFSLDDNEELVVAARAAAWTDAMAKAEQLASLSGTTLGAPVSITESFSSSPAPLEYARAEAAADATFTPIAPGQETVTVNLQVRFAIGS